MSVTCMRFFPRSAEASDARLFTSLLERYLSKTCPKKFFIYEDRRIDYRAGTLGDFWRLWQSETFFWQTKKPEIYGLVSPGTQYEHTTVAHSFDTSLAEDAAGCQFFIEFAKGCHVDYACLHARGNDSRTAELVSRKPVRPLP